MHPLCRCLPINRQKWPEHLKAQRALYQRFVDDLVLNPAKNVTQGSAGSHSEETSATASTPDSDDRSVEASPPIADSGGVPARNGEAVAISEESHQSTNETSPLERIGAPDNGRIESEHEGTLSTAGSEAAAAAAAPSTSPRRSPGDQGTRRPADDDPLSNKETSEWAALWSDKELMQAIEQDVIRTMPDLAFYACRGVDEDDDEYEHSVDDGRGTIARREQSRRGRERRAALARILFVHAKLNPAESYTQGMNEIVATLYFVLATEGNEEWHRHCEADTFFCFTNLMAEIRDVFIQSLDDSESGLHGKSEKKIVPCTYWKWITWTSCTLN